jgi:very-short-patch-repair endonuclease
VKEKLDRIEFARLQRHTANSYEQCMWSILRNRQREGMKFRRQQPLGPYTADFVCAEARLVVEIDGADHFTEKGKRHDANRDRWMKEQGIRVLRFTGKQVDLDSQAACEAIDAALRAQHPSPPTPLPQRVEGRRLIPRGRPRS